MIKRPLCMACLLFLAVQAVRVFGLKCAAVLQPSALERAASEGTRLTLAGTVDRIEEKEKVTAVFLKDNTVSVRGQHVNESKLLVYIEQNSTAEIKQEISYRCQGRSLLLILPAIREILTRRHTIRDRGSMCWSGQSTLRFSPPKRTG